MFSLLAWPRALAISLLLLTLFSQSYALEQSVFTSSVTYCNPPETLLIQRFELAYFPTNNSISFNVSAASVQANINVTANLFLNVYGMNPVNVTLDLCGIFGGALCPLPMYNFTGADSITLPSAFDVAKSVPGIAYVIPDLEGFAQLSLTEIHTGTVKACVQLTLSNGRSAHQAAVEWTTGGVALAVLVVAFWQSTIFPQGILPFRLIELMTLYQTIASSSFLSLNYPSVYRAFALNFAWAMGLISSSSIQNSINHMRHLTGGNLADANGGSAVGLVNRKLSPYNSPNSDIVSQFTSSFGSILSRSLPPNLVSILHPSLVKSFTASDRQTIVNGQVQTVTAVSSNVLQAGIPIYVNTPHIATANAFMTVFLCVLCILGVALVIFAIGYGLLFIVQRVQSRRHTRMGAFTGFDYTSFVLSWFLRIALLVFFPLMIFLIYQWTLKDSWLSILISVISFVLISAALLYPGYLIFRTTRQESVLALYTYKSKQLARNGPLYAQQRAERYYFSGLLIVAFFLRALFIGAAKSSGEAQLALMIIVELGLVLAHCILKPSMTRGGDVFETYLSICRLVCTALLIAFIEKLQVNPIPRVVIGIVIALAWSVAVLVVIGNIAWNAVVAVKIRHNMRSISSSTLESPAGSEGSMLEKGTRRTPKCSTKSDLIEKDMAQTTGSTDSFGYVAERMDAEDIEVVCRPVNPTPENNVPFDQYNHAPYPISPTGTTISTMDPPSLYSRDSESITVGSLLPRRWSNSLSQPVSPAPSSYNYRSSLTPSSIPPSSPSDATHNGALSRNASVRMQQHQPTHEDIQEEEAVEPLSSKSSSPNTKFIPAS